MGFIYLVINNINNKKYIGQTKLTIEKRWERHIYDAQNKNDDFYFHKAIRKYNPSNFTITQLEECDNSLLDEQEIYYIELYKTYYIYGYGYNLTRGGSGFTKVNQKLIMEKWNNGEAAI